MVGSSSDWRQIDEEPLKPECHLGKDVPISKVNQLGFPAGKKFNRCQFRFGLVVVINQGTPKVPNKHLMRWARWNVSFEYHFGLLHAVCTKYQAWILSKLLTWCPFCKLPFLRCLFAYCLLALCVFAYCLFACWLFAWYLFACCLFAWCLFACCLFALCLFVCWLFAWCLLACCFFALCLFEWCLFACCLLAWCLFLRDTYMIFSISSL